MLKKGPPVKIFLLVALLFFNQSLFALEDDGQLNDDPGAIDYNNENIEMSDEVDVSERPPEHADYPVEETHQVLRYVQERADAPKYYRDPQIKVVKKSKKISHAMKKNKTNRPKSKHKKTHVKTGTLPAQFLDTLV